MNKGLLILLVGLVALSASAAPLPRFNHVSIMTAYGELARVVADISISADQAAARDDKTIAQLKAEFPKALAQTKGHPDLTAAVKTYYAAALSFFGGLDPQAAESSFLYRARVSALETRLKEAKAGVDVELQALGVD